MEIQILVILCSSLIITVVYGDNITSTNSSIAFADFETIDETNYQLANQENLLIWNSEILGNSVNLDESIRFYAYTKTKDDGTICQELNLEDKNSLRQANVKRRKAVKILIHGFHSNCTVSPFPQIIIEAYLKTYRKSYTVICVDWGLIATPLGELSSLLYTQSVRHIDTVGEKVARLVAFLCNEKIIDDANQVHIIGFSLGAHVAGIAGNAMQNIYNTKIGRITGLDPAGPSFEHGLKGDDYKLDNKDAKFVDIIHTNMGHLGIREKLGHADFYPNGGERQPRCYRENLLISLSESIFGRCSHRSSSIYFEQSIRSKKLIACECQSWDKYKNTRQGKKNNKCSRKQSAVLGEHCLTSTRGNFCLEI